MMFPSRNAWVRTSQGRPNPTFGRPAPFPALGADSNRHLRTAHTGDMRCEEHEDSRAQARQAPPRLSRDCQALLGCKP